MEGTPNQSDEQNQTKPKRVAQRYSAAVKESAYDLHANGKTAVEISKILNIHASTIRTWLKNPAFLAGNISDAASPKVPRNTKQSKKEQLANKSTNEAASFTEQADSPKPRSKAVTASEAKKRKIVEEAPQKSNKRSRRSKAAPESEEEEEEEEEEIEDEEDEEMPEREEGEVVESEEEDEEVDLGEEDSEEEEESEDDGSFLEVEEGEIVDNSVQRGRAKNQAKTAPRPIDEDSKDSAIDNGTIRTENNNVIQAGDGTPSLEEAIKGGKALIAYLESSGHPNATQHQINQLKMIVSRFSQ